MEHLNCYYVIIRTFAYKRAWENQELIVICNFYGNEVEIELDTDQKEATILISNYEESPVMNNKIKLRPYEAIVYQLN